MDIKMEALSLNTETFSVWIQYIWNTPPPVPEEPSDDRYGKHFKEIPKYKKQRNVGPLPFALPTNQ